MKVKTVQLQLVAGFGDKSTLVTFKRYFCGKLLRCVDLLHASQIPPILYSWQLHVEFNVLLKASSGFTLLITALTFRMFTNMDLEIFQILFTALFSSCLPFSNYMSHDLAIIQ